MVLSRCVSRTLDTVQKQRNHYFPGFDDDDSVKWSMLHLWCLSRTCRHNEGVLNESIVTDYLVFARPLLFSGIQEHPRHRWVSHMRRRRVTRKHRQTLSSLLTAAASRKVTVNCCSSLFANMHILFTVDWCKYSTICELVSMFFNEMAYKRISWEMRTWFQHHREVCQHELPHLILKQSCDDHLTVARVFYPQNSNRERVKISFHNT